MFFPRLRRHAKWVFAFLAGVFAISFVAFGIGAGGVGIGNIFQGHSGSSGVPSVSASQKRINENPKDAQAFHDLSTALQAKGDTSGAIAALTSYTGLRPRDTSALRELARLYIIQAGNAQQRLQDAQVREAYLAPNVTLSSTFTLGGQPLAVDPITNAYDSTISSDFQAAQSDETTAARNAISTYKKIATITPKDPAIQLELADTARAIGDTTTAIEAYKRYLQIAPATDTTRPSVQRLLKQLQPRSGTG